jgi:hypothetical protein
VAPPRPESRLPSLPPILRIPSPDPTSGYSKAPRGLFVLSRVGRIFTASSISPGPSLRQRPCRYAIRAGRNLPDKEFRYLRTVIVTAAIDRGFGSALARLPLTFRHRAGVTPYTSPSGLAGSCVFGKQSPGPGHCGPPTLPGARPVHPSGRPFSRSYGANLPSSLTRDHPFPLAHLCPATSVGLRYGRARLPARGFSWRLGAAKSPSVARRLSPASGLPPARLDAATPAPRSAFPAPSPGRTCSSACGNGISTVCPSPTPFGLGLGPTHPPRMGLPEETSAIRGACFSQALRYSCRHSHSHALHQPSQADFTARGTLPYHTPVKLAHPWLRRQA